MTDWVSLARDAYEKSTTYFDAAYRTTFEQSVAHFQSRHSPDSKYLSELYKHRSKIFRPKTRSHVRKSEAAAAAAFFSNTDVVSVEPPNETDPRQKMGAELMGEVLNFRLTQAGNIRWFQTVLGAWQETKVFGAVCSYQYWKYLDEETQEPVMDMMGQPMMDEDGEPMEQAARKVIEDRPCVELIPIENVRFDPGADWIDPVNSSPYFIRRIPMYVQDVRQRMESKNAKTGEAEWKEYDDNIIQGAIDSSDSVRLARDDKKPDRYEESAPISDFAIVWVHENFIRVDGVDHHYYTLAADHLLTDPKPVSEVYFHGERPFVIGVSSIEAHKPVPQGDVEIVSPLQREINENANSRLDNVKLVLNKRWLVKRNTNVDLQSLLRNVPGAVTLTDSIDAVQEVNWPDVTGSAFQEQDRLNLDADDLLGNFSQSSVMSNRQLNETVGGMKMLGSGANMVQEYSLRIFVETWMEPVLAQLVKLERAYETDMAVLAVAGQKAQLWEKYGQDQVSDQMLDQDLTVRVNVGMGATDPQQKIQKMAMAFDMYGRFSMLPNVDSDKLKEIIFGYAGVRSAAAAFKPAEQAGPPPQVQAMLKEIQTTSEELKKREMAVMQKEYALNIKAAQTQNTLIKQEAAISQKAAQAELQMIAKGAQVGMQAIRAKSETPGPQGPDPVEMRKLDLEEKKIEQKRGEILFNGAIDLKKEKMKHEAAEAQAEKESAKETEKDDSLAAIGAEVAQLKEILNKPPRTLKGIRRVTVNGELRGAVREYDDGTTEEVEIA